MNAARLRSLVVCCALVALAILILSPDSYADSRGRNDPVRAQLGPNPDDGGADAVPAPRQSTEERIRQWAEQTRVPAPGGAAEPLSPATSHFDVDEIGGDDRIIAIQNRFGTYAIPSIDVASNGDLYVAIDVEVPGPDLEIHVYRSTDRGKTWSLWGTKGDISTSSRFKNPRLHVAEGLDDRLFLAYEHEQIPGDDRILVSYSPLGGASAVWTDRTVLSSAGVDFEFADLHSDKVHFADYFLYLAASGNDGNGDDIWFARSTTRGSTWEAGYRIGTLTSSDRDYQFPRVTYGRNGQVHCVWTLRYRTGTLGDAVRYRRALNSAASGVSDWETLVALTSATDNQDESGAIVAASHSAAPVLVAFKRRDPVSMFVMDPRVWVSPDGGATWSVTDSTSLDDLGPADLVHAPGGFVYTADDRLFDVYGIRRSTEATPTAMSAHLSFVDRSYHDGFGPGNPRMTVINPALGNRVGLVWSRIVSGDQPDTLFLDAEWFSDPGWPNLEPGFPVALQRGAISPPAICELDGDPESELVFGDTEGFVFAMNHNGTHLPGWPKDVGTIAQDSPVAVGDLDGDGVDEIVVGNSAGEVHAYRANGATMPGFPVNLGTNDSTYCSIGAINGSSNRQIVATSGFKLFLLSAAGVTQPGFPITTVGRIRSSAAIGDVDNNGLREIVILQEKFLNVISPTGVNQANRSFPSHTFSNAPTLADLNFDGDLEIACPTDQGDLFIVDHTTADHPGWPKAVATSPLSSVAFANIRAGFEPEVIVSVYTSPASVAAYFQDGVALSGYPKTTDPFWFVPAMPIADVIDNGSSDVIVPSRDSFGYAWDNFGTDLGGWPAGLGGITNVSAASGDIDNDGKVEVVFTTLAPARLLVYDLGAAIKRGSGGGLSWWPMYGYNPERQGCLGCQDRVVDVPGNSPRPTALRLRAPVPNPSGAPLAFAFDLPVGAAAELAVFDVAGRRVRTLVRGSLPAGTHQSVWDGRSETGARAPAGVYLVRLAVDGAAGREERVQRAVLLR